MALSGNGGDKFRGGSRSVISTGKPSPGISKRDEHTQKLEHLFDKTYSKIQELSHLLKLEENTLNARVSDATLHSKVSDVGLQSALQRQDKLVQVSRMVLKRESFGSNAPWGRNHAKSLVRMDEKGSAQKNHIIRHGSDGMHGSPMGEGNLPRSRGDSSNQSFQVSPRSGTARDDEEMFRRAGAIPKNYNRGQMIHGTPEMVNRSLANIETVGHGRSKEDPGAERLSQNQHDSTYTMGHDDDEGGFQRNIDDAAEERSMTWYGSLDRNFAKRRRAQTSDKQRRHTKAVGILPWAQANEIGMDSGKKTIHELGPDEQYTFGLPHVANVQSSKLSTTILASLSHTLSPKSSGSKPQHYFYSPQNNVAHQPSGSTPAENLVHMSTPKQYHSSTLLHGSPRSSMFVGQSRLPSPILQHTPFTGLQDKKVDSLSKQWDDMSMDSRNFSVHERTRSVVVSTGNSPLPSAGSERIVGSMSNLQIADGPNDVVDCGTSSKGEQMSSVSKESTKPFEMADYYKYSTKFRSQHHSQSSDATSGSQNERNRFSSSSASSSSSAIDSGLSARSLILKNFFMQLPYDDSVELLKVSGPPGENNSWVPPHLKNWYSMDFKTQNSILESYVMAEEALAAENAKRESSELNSSNAPSTSMSTNSSQLPTSSQSVLSPDENGNNMSSTDQAPELPPRQPRERKDSTIENGRISENKNQAWIMDTPTFV